MSINRRIFTRAKRVDPDFVVVTVSLIAAAIVLVLDIMGALPNA